MEHDHANQSAQSPRKVMFTEHVHHCPKCRKPFKYIIYENRIVEQLVRCTCGELLPREVAPDEPRDLLEEAFILGFMASREGFNGECQINVCSPDQLEAFERPESEFRELLARDVEFQRLKREALNRLSAYTGDGQKS